ncbi:MAG: hypothetical protein ACYDIE_06610 [Candidatus Krumholzibacteriia bacterium]
MAAGVVVLLAALAGGVASGRAADDAPVAIHPAVGDTLDAREAARFGLFTDEPGLQTAVLLPAPWGGYLARLTLVTPSGTVTHERNVPTALLLAWRARVARLLAAPTAAADTAAVAPAAVTPTAVTPAAADSLTAAADSSAGRAPAPSARIRVCPEVPLPAPRSRPPGLDAVPPAPTAPAPVRWLVTSGLGYRHCTSDFNHFFTDMGQLEIAVSRRLGRTLVPYAAFLYGFGDIQDDFEAVSANGRSALYALETGLLARVRVSRGAHAYVGLGGGYYMRSLRWGGDQFIGTDGYVYGGTLVRELQDWGGSVRLGVQLALSPTGKARKARLLDFALRFEEYARSSFEPFGADSAFRASGRDRWLAFSVSLLSGL